VLKRLADDPELRERLGRAGRRYVELHHTRAAAADTWEALLTDVTGAARS
jgi:hypothetical protein